MGERIICLTIIVMMVNIMIARPWVTLSSARASADLASMMLACCCFKSSKSFNYSMSVEITSGSLG